MVESTVAENLSLAAVVVEVLLYVHRNRRFIRDVHVDFHTPPEL